MRKIKLLSVLVLLFISGNVFAQKSVNVDNLRFNYFERQLPQRPLNPPFFYYAVKIDLPGSIRNYVDEQSLYEMVDIVGQRVANEPANDDVIITVKMLPVIIAGNSVKERISEKKARDGTVTKESFYKMEVVYNFESNAVVAKEGTAIYRFAMFSRIGNITFESGEYKTGKEASDYWRNNREVLIEQFTRECAEKSMTILSKSLNDFYGFPIKKESTLIKTINEKNHSENDILRANCNEIKARMEALDGNTPLTEDDMSDLINYFKSIPDKYNDTSSKAHAQLRYVAYFNLCRIYMFVNQPEQVKEWADLLLVNGIDKKDAQGLKKDADAQTKRFDRFGIRTSQFDTNDYFTD